MNNCVKNLMCIGWMWDLMVSFASMVLLRNLFFIYGSGSFTKAFAVFRYCPSDDVLYQKLAGHSPRLSSKRMPNMSPLLTPNQIQSRKPGLRLSGSIGRAHTAVTVPWGSRPRM